MAMIVTQSHERTSFCILHLYKNVDQFDNLCRELTGDNACRRECY